MKKVLGVVIAVCLCAGLIGAVSAEGDPGPKPRACGNPLCWGTG